MKKINKFLIILFLLFFVSFLLRFSLTYYTPVKYWDETIYANLGRNLFLYNEYSFFHGFADFSSNWPLAGFRAPLLPFLISIVSLFSLNPFILNFIIPIIASLGVVGFYLLVKEMFDKKVAIYSALLYSVFPLNVFWGSKLLTDTLLITIVIFAVYFFYLGFFKNSESYLNYILFGIFSALAFLSRYSMIWFFVLFFCVLFVKFKDLSFLKNKDLWVSVFCFLIIVVPWFIFNYISYGSLFGFLIHAQEASLRWGSQSFLFYIKSLFSLFFLFIPFFILGVLNRKYRDSRNFMIIWFFIIIISASLMSHKEVRYILPILPAIVCLSSLGLVRLKKYGEYLFYVLILLFLIFNFGYLKSSYYSFDSEDHKCFFGAMDFIKDSSADYVVTEHFSPVYFYTLKPNIRVNNYTFIKGLIETEYFDNEIYYYYETGDWFNLTAETDEINNLVYSCNKFNVFDISLRS